MTINGYDVEQCNNKKNVRIGHDAVTRKRLQGRKSKETQIDNM